MTKLNQKKIALINDVTGFGRCSIAVSLPIVSALKVQCSFIPTAILSNHTDFNNFFFEDYTPKMKEYISNWEMLGLSFDAIYTGFLGSKEQIEIVIEFLEKFKTDNNIIVIDPVMGDYGNLYSTYTDEMCVEMKKLVKHATILTPNLTELYRLLDLPYPKSAPSHEELYSLCKKLSIDGPNKIVVTGIQRENMIENFVFESNKPFEIISVEKIGKDRCGTGDVFTSIISASVVKGENFASSIKKATEFISKSLIYTNNLNLPSSHGVCFEEFLTELK